MSLKIPIQQIVIDMHTFRQLNSFDLKKKIKNDLITTITRNKK